MRAHLPSLIYALWFLGHASFAAIYTSPSSILDNTYDFIVVGAGTAGGVVATRLSENTLVKVLVIEAGPADTGSDSYLIQTPFLGGQAPLGTRFDWNYTVVNQAGLDNRNFSFPRGHVIGGSSAINNEAYFRGTSEDFDLFAEISGDDGWSWSNMQPYIYKNERHVLAWNNQSDVGKYNPSVHGYGPLLSSLPVNNSILDSVVMNSSRQLHEQYPFNLDFNSGHGLGIGWMQNTVGNSARSNSATAFLTPAATSRPNLDVLLQTHVTRLIQTAKATFKGVQISQGPSYPNFTLTAQKEVILSAGSVGTPQILQLSGIGQKSYLQSLGITSVVNLPDVGQNLQDQILVMTQYSVNGSTLNPFLNDSAAFGTALAQYTASKTGTMASSCLINTVGFLRIPNNDSIWTSFSDPAIGPNSPHYVMAFLNAYGANPGQALQMPGDWITVINILQSPTSRGSINIISSSPFVYPSINPAYLSTSSDIGFYRQAIKYMGLFLTADPWKGFLLQPHPDAANLTDDTAIESYLRKFATTIKHPVGTAIISNSSSSVGVVGPDLTVKNTHGLRIVDASVIPRAVSGFPQARVYLIAERASDLIKAKYSCNRTTNKC